MVKHTWHFLLLQWQFRYLYNIGPHFYTVLEVIQEHQCLGCLLSPETGLFRNKNINYGYCLLMRWLLSAALSAEVVGLSTAFKARYACSSFKGHNLLISLCVGSLCLAEFRIMQVCLSREDTWPLDLMFCRSTKHFEKNLESIVTVNEENNKNNNNKLNFNVYTIWHDSQFVNHSTCKTHWCQTVKQIVSWNLKAW